MNSLAKAAVISAAIVIAILAACFLLLPMMRRGPQPQDLVAETGAPPKPEVKAPPRPAGTAIKDETIHRGSVKLTIQVLEKGRKRQLAGARAMVLKATDGDRTGERVWESTDDPAGKWEVGLEPGAYVVRAQCPRYKGDKRSVTLVKETPQTIVFELERGTSISGRVLAAGGGPIGGARVLALKELAEPGADLEEILMGMIGINELTGKTAYAAETVSAEDGTYQLDGLEVKTYTVRAVAPGYTPGEVKEVPAPRAEVDVVLQKGGTVSGIVKDTAGNPIEDAEVSAYSELQSQNVFEIIMAKARPPIDVARTGTGGQFQFKTLGPGLHNFLIEARGYQRGEQVKVRVTPGETSGLAFTLKPGVVLRGIVTAPSGEPIQGAKVRASPMGVAAAGRKEQVNINFDDDSVLTNEQGEFVIDTLDEGTYMVLCYHQDYQTLRKNDVYVRASNPDELQLKLSVGGRIKGVVTDSSTGKPVVGARLSSSDVADFHKDAVSDEAGAFILAGLTAGVRSVTVTVIADGYARIRRDVKVEENREVEEKFALEPTGLVSGRVVNSNGEGIPGARVQAKRTQEGGGVDPILATDVTDQDGKFSLVGIEAGQNTWIRVKKGEYLDGQSEAFTVNPSEPFELEPIVLRLGGSIRGTVLGADGKGLSGCMVHIAHEGETELEITKNPSAPTNARGEFQLQGLQSGPIELIVKATHYMDKKVTGLEVIESKVLRDVVIRLEQGNSVGGIVVDGKGNPVANADVIARDMAQGAKELRTSSGTDGRFTVENIVANDAVELEVIHDNYGGFSDQNVRVGSADMKVVLKELASLRGKVITSEGEVVDSFTVQAQNPGTKDPRKQPKPQSFNPADGTFEYRGVPGGTYTVHVRAPQYSTATLSDIRVEEGQALDLGEIVLQVGGIVNGTVVDSVTKAPIDGAKVQVVQGTTRFLKSELGPGAPGVPSPLQTTGADGRFKFTSLKGGNLTLKASHTTYVSQKIDDVNPDVADKSQDLVIELSQGGSVTGTVLDPEGKPRPGMAVFLIGSEPGTNQSGQTDREGRFTFGSVSPGTYTVKAHKFTGAGATPEQAEVTVQMESGGAQDVVLQLK